MFSSSSNNEQAGRITIPIFQAAEDPTGVLSHIPHMDHFYNNSLQTGLMRDLAIDLELLGEHIVLLGNQGVGKNKIVDRLCQVSFPCHKSVHDAYVLNDTSSFVAHASTSSFIETQLLTNLCS